MSTLPARLRPWWPYFKRTHRLLCFLTGLATRGVSPFLGRRGVPRRASLTSRATAAAEPESVSYVEAGAGYRMSRTLPPGEPALHPVFRAGEQVDVPHRYVVEIDGGLVTGDYGAVVTPGGRLDYETSSYFDIASWREHPLYLRPTVGATVHVPGRVLSLTSPGTATNYYHFLYDAIGRLEVLEASGVDRDVDAVVVPHGSRYQRELLELVGIDVPLFQVDRGQSVLADRLVVPSTPNSKVIAPTGTVSWLRRTLMPEGIAPEPRDRIYITRGNAPGMRSYLQEDELWPQLEARGFRRVDPGTFSVREQIDMFSRAGIVVAPHGAGLSNITFSPPGVQVLELFAPSYVHLGLWGICEALGHVRYQYLVGEGSGRRDRLRRPFDDISVDPRRVVAAVDRMIADHDDGGTAIVPGAPRAAGTEEGRHA